MAFPKSKILSTKQMVRLLQESSSNGERFCFILGSGASVESDIDTGNKLEMKWMNCLMGEEADGGTPPMDPNESRKMGKKLYEDDLIQHDPAEIEAEWKNAVKYKTSMSSEYYFDIYKWRFYPSRRNGYRYLESLMEDKEPSIGYHTLARILTDGCRNNLVITTNFDNLVEDALFLYTDKKPLVVSHESLACYIESDIQRPIVAKVHRGLMYAPFNSPETTCDLQKEWRETLNYAFNTYTPVVIGYGGGDRSLMAFLESPDTLLPHGIYWCYLDSTDSEEDLLRNLPEKNIQKLVAEKDGHFVRIKGFDALMLEIGEALYSEWIIPGGAEAILKKRCHLRISKYIEQWDKVKKNPATKSTADRLDEDEQKAADTREQKHVMTDWDCYRRGYDAQSKKQYDDAIMWYTKAIEMNREFVWAYNNRGNVYHDLKKYEKALADYDKAIALAPEDAIAYNNRGNTYQVLKEYEKALADYDKAIALNPEYTDAYISRGNVYYNMEDYDKALADYDKAIALAPEYALAYNNRGNTYQVLKEYEKALADYDKAIALNPEYTDAYNNRGNTYQKLKEYEKALVDYDKAIALDPEYAYPYRNRADAYLTLERYEDAVATCTKAIELDQNYKEAYLDRARAYRALGEVEKAEADEEKAAELEFKK